MTHTSSASRTARTIEIRLLNVEPPPGFNHAYRIIKRPLPLAKQTPSKKSYSSLGLTPDAELWIEMLSDRLRYEMARLGIKPRHVIVTDKKSGQPVLRPSGDSPYFITVFYRLVTSYQDSDAPVKILLDSAIEKGIGISDRWVCGAYPVKLFAEPRRVEDIDPKNKRRRTRTLVQRPYMHIVVMLEPVADKDEFNELARTREVALLTAMGARGLLPEEEK